MSVQVNELLYWLLRAYRSGHREGWEEGPNVRETLDGIHSLLCNYEIDPSYSLANELLKHGPLLLDVYQQCFDCGGGGTDENDARCSFCKGVGFVRKPSEGE